MPDNTSIFAKMFAVANTAIRSPLHSLLSGRLMLLEYVGAKTSTQYSLTVDYFPWDDGDVVIFSSANWPKTIERARNVRVLIKGRFFTGPHGDQTCRAQSRTTRHIRETQRDESSRAHTSAVPQQARPTSRRVAAPTNPSHCRRPPESRSGRCARRWSGTAGRTPGLILPFGREHQAGPQDHSLRPVRKIPKCGCCSAPTARHALRGRAISIDQAAGGPHIPLPSTPPNCLRPASIAPFVVVLDGYRNPDSEPAYM